jgi:prefoldin subunit 5
MDKELKSFIKDNFDKLTKTIQVLEDRLDEISCNLVDKSNVAQQDNQPETNGLQEKELIELLDRYIQKTKE